jgi:GLPGLI family protein
LCRLRIMDILLWRKRKLTNMRRIILFFFIAITQNICGQNGHNIEYAINWTNNDYEIKSHFVFNDSFAFYYFITSEDKLKDSINFGSLVINHAHFYDRKNNLIYYEVDYPLGNTYLIKDTIKEIIWNILPQTKIVLGYNCFKATAKVKSRKVIVWFTKELGNGKGHPWYAGVPGVPLIVIDKNQKWEIKVLNIVEGNYFFNLPNVPIKVR